MATVIGSITKFSGGIADSEKEGQPDSFYFAKSFDFRSDAKKLQVLPKTVKESGTLIEDLPKWAERISDDTYVYDESGNLYKRDSDSVYTKVHTAADSHGNGMAYFAEDKFLYYMQDKTIGRYGPIGGVDDPRWTDGFLEAEGGEPTNTHSIVLEADSSQYLYTSDHADLSYTSDFALEAGYKPESLPASGERQVLLSKWDDQGVGIRLMTADITPDKIYQHSGFATTIVDSFSSPSTQPRGVAWDGDNCLSGDIDSGKIYKHSGFSSTISDSFSSPSSDVIDVGWDGTHLLSTDYTSDRCYKHSGFSATISDSFAHPATGGSVGPTGISWDGINVLSSGNANTGRCYKHSGFSSTISSSFSSPSTVPTGVGWDGANLLSIDIGSDKCYKHSGFSATISDSFSSPSNNPYSFEKGEGGLGKAWMFDIGTVAAYYGDGSDGNKTISTDTTDEPIDSSCSGTVDTYTLSATNGSFAAGQKILIIQMQGTNAGICQTTEIQAYTAGTITTTDPLSISYSSSGSNAAQVIVIKQYVDVTVNASVTWKPKAWNGTVGGILAFVSTGTVTVNGTIDATSQGFRGGARGYDYGTNQTGQQGESYEGTGSQTYTANGGGGGGGEGGQPTNGGGNGGGGGGHKSNGEDGQDWYATTGEVGEAGNSYGAATLDKFYLGSGGGGGGMGDALPSASKGGGGDGAGGIIILCNVLTINTSTGYIKADGEDGEDASHDQAGGGAGSGGSILIYCQSATIGTNRITITRAYGGNWGEATFKGGNSSYGRSHIYYKTSVTGTGPTLTQDQTLSTDDGYSLRLHLSDDGTNSEILNWDITEDITTDEWARWQVAFDASASTAYFYKNGELLGQDTGTMTSIYDSTALAMVGAYIDSDGNVAGFADGNLDDIRTYNDLRTATELATYTNKVITNSTPNLKAYWKFDNDATDDGTGNNDLTAVNSPTYDINDVLFAGITSRGDLDQSLDTSGNTYTLPTAINEGSAHRQTFTPAKEPQKSLEVNIETVGTGNWTLTVHDALHRTIAQQTVTNSELYTGDYEFIFDTAWRPVLSANYHFHLTSTVADGTVVTTDSNDLETADFHTYFQILVEDTDFHPAIQMLNKLIIGNDRYVATHDGISDNYEPHQLTLPSGYRVRCFAHWREYCAIGTWKGTDITDYDEGRIFFWDGISDTYNFYIDVPEGGVNAMVGTKGLLYIWAGYSGDMLVYMGGERAQKIKRLPFITRDKYVEIFPGAVGVWRSLVHFGVAGNTDSTDVYQGVYSWGALNRNYNDSLGFDFPLSFDQYKATDIRIGMVKAVGQNLLIGWQYGVSYGIDVVNITADAYAKASYEALISDLGAISQESYPLTLRADFEPLVSGQSVTVKYKADRESSYKDSDTEDTVGATELRMIIQEQVNEIQVATDVETTISTGVVVTGLTLETELAQEEIPA